jgi:hypothetical protein
MEVFGRLQAGSYSGNVGGTLTPSYCTIPAGDRFIATLGAKKKARSGERALKLFWIGRILSSVAPRGAKEDQ